MGETWFMKTLKTLKYDIHQVILDFPPMLNLSLF